MDYKQKTKEIKKAMKELRYAHPFTRAKQINPKELCERLINILKSRYFKKNKS